MACILPDTFMVDRIFPLLSRSRLVFSHLSHLCLSAWSLYPSACLSFYPSILLSHHDANIRILYTFLFPSSSISLPHPLFTFSVVVGLPNPLPGTVGGVKASTFFNIQNYIARASKGFFYSLESVGGGFGVVHKCHQLKVVPMHIDYPLIR